MIMVKPKDEAQPGTLHKLRNQNDYVVFQWTGTGWCVPGPKMSGLQNNPKQMATLGWVYVEPKLEKKDQE